MHFIQKNYRWSAGQRLALLTAGALTGLLFAVTSLFISAERNSTRLPVGVAARIEDRIITKEEYEGQVQRLAADKRNPLTEQDRRYVLDRMIEEELLILRGLEIGLTESSPPVRKAIASAMITQIVTEAVTEEPSQADIEAFYRDNKSFFASPGRMRLRDLHIPFSGNMKVALNRAQQLHAQLRSGEPLDQLLKTGGDLVSSPLPDTLLPPIKIADYLGPSLTMAAMELEPGEFSDPISSSNGYDILYMADREAEGAPPLEEIIDQVAAEYRRQAGDRALREYLDWLRSRAAVVVQPEYEQLQRR